MHSIIITFLFPRQHGFLPVDGKQAGKNEEIAFITGKLDAKSISPRAAIPCKLSSM